MAVDKFIINVEVAIRPWEIKNTNWGLVEGGIRWSGLLDVVLVRHVIKPSNGWYQNSSDDDAKKYRTKDIRSSGWDMPRRIL